MKVDSGPGRTNIEMLAYLRVLGIYCVPSVPNTTQVSQETDQSYDLFKTIFRTNLEVLVRTTSVRSTLDNQSKSWVKAIRKTIAGLISYQLNTNHLN